MEDALIFDAVRTPRGKGRAGGALHTTSPSRLAASAITAVHERQGLPSDAIEEVALGCVEPVMDQGANIARTAALLAGLSDRVPGITVSRFCSSGLDAVNMIAAQVCAGMLDLGLGGGVESMSRVPMMSSGGAWGTDPDLAQRIGFVPQGVAADLFATLHGYTRKNCDAYAVQSQQRAAVAVNEHRFRSSLIPVCDPNGIVLLAGDEHPRPGVTSENLAQLKPAFAQQSEQAGFGAVARMMWPQVERIDHVHHAGNSSGVVDGAAAVLVGSERAARRYGLRARARIRAWACVGSEPTLMFRGPGPATELVLRRAGMQLSDVDLFEVNEAFAVMPLWYQDHFDIDPLRVNVNGGAIAFGHPLGATGAMLLGTVLDELERRGETIGLVALCVASGMGTATIVERI